MADAWACIPSQELDVSYSLGSAWWRVFRSSKNVAFRRVNFNANILKLLTFFWLCCHVFSNNN